MNTNKKIYSLVIIGVFAAIISIISAIPLGFEIFGVRASLQTFAMALAGFTLGHKKGTLTVFIYILILYISPYVSSELRSNVLQELSSTLRWHISPTFR